MRCLGFRWTVLGAILIAVTSCAHLPFGRGKGQEASSSDVALEEAGSVGTPADNHEAELRSIVRAHIEAANRHQDKRRSKVVHRRPYFYKEYDVYPDDTDTFSTVLQETEL